MKDVLLGYEMGRGTPVHVPIRHMVVAGQTQEAGKTTTLEALVARAERTAIAFVTKRGEGSFASGRRIQPYFRERADWQFVASLLEATMRERMKFERSWIINVSKGARTLAQVHANVKKALLTARGINEGVYTTLDAYLDIVVPRISQVSFADHLELKPGLNVLDLSDRDTFPSELQSLVMRSVLERVYEKHEGVITIIPEAWEFLPQGRGSPVKLAATELIRKGASLRNYVWLDSQDIGGIDKEILRSCPVWLLGVQRESNEIKRVLGNIPDGLAKPKPGQIAVLEKGQFYACWGQHAVKTYVRPAWMGEVIAMKVARGEPDAELLAATLRPTSAPPKPEPIRKVAVAAARSTNDEDEPMSKAAEEKLDEVIALLKKQPRVAAAPPAPAAAPPVLAGGAADAESLYQFVKERLIKEAPAIVALLAEKPEIVIKQERVTVDVDLKSCKGMVAQLLSDGFFDTTTTANAAWKETQRRWDNRGNAARVYEQCDWFTSKGFLTKEVDGYRVVEGMKSSVVSR